MFQDRTIPFDTRLISKVGFEGNGFHAGFTALTGAGGNGAG